MHIRKRSRGRYQAVIRIKNSYLTKTFLDRNSCVAWGKTQEQLLYNYIRPGVVGAWPSLKIH